MAAGLAQLRELERVDGWKRLEKLGAQLEQATKESLGKTKTEASFHRIGSMFCLFFTAGPVLNLEDARRSDIGRFVRFFNHCLDAGVYFAPSQFETGFISTAHQPEQIDADGAHRARGAGAGFSLGWRSRKTFASLGSLH